MKVPKPIKRAILIFKNQHSLSDLIACFFKRGKVLSCTIKVIHGIKVQSWKIMTIVIFLHCGFGL